MGDLRDSPPRTIWTASYHKAWRSFKAVVEISKMIRFPIPIINGVGRSGGDLFEGDNSWWYFFSFFSLFSLFASFLVWADGSAEAIGLLPYFIVFMGGSFVHSIALYSVAYWHRETSPFGLIGAKAKFIIEVIPMVVAAAMRHLFDLNYVFLLLLLGCTAYFYTFAHLLHVAYDIGRKDTLLGVAMLVLVHKLNDELLAGALALIFCIGLSFYRYITCCAPELPNHSKKELRGAAALLI